MGGGAFVDSVIALALVLGFTWITLLYAGCLDRRDLEDRIANHRFLKSIEDSRDQIAHGDIISLHPEARISHAAPNSFSRKHDHVAK